MGECESCERIWSGRTSLDVVEIDAASNRGVEDARDLRERAMYSPSNESRYKVYIIDEAHMLTREAWNAFLKILEEPPPRVIFVLATTEPGRILQAAPPILSRCQRFDFHRISTELITERLEEVLSAEEVEADPAALLPIARKAEGALRDALSSLDQVLAFSGSEVGVEDVRRVLGLIGEEKYLDLFEILADKQAAEVFGYVDGLIEQGYDLEEFQRGLGEAIRTLLRIRLEDGDEPPDVAPHLADRYRELSGRFAVGDLLRMLSALAELDVDGNFRKSEQQRILIEVLLLRFAMMDRTIELEELLEAAKSDNPGSGTEPRRRNLPARTTASGRPADAESAESARSAESADSADSADAPVSRGATGGFPASSVREAWLGMIADGRVLRPGQGIALRAVELGQLGADGELAVTAVAGTPGAEVLADAVTRRRIEEELSGRLGRPIRITLQEASGGKERVSEGSKRRQRLEQLVEGDEGLQELVDELDLEIMD